MAARLQEGGSREGGGMLFFGFRHLAPSGRSFGCLRFGFFWGGGFVNATGDKCCERGAS